MPRFAHLSDVHIGAFRQPELKELVTEAFRFTIRRCIEEKVDFVIISGDIFDSNIPDLSSVGKAARIIREACDLGIRFYVVYGSHDYSPNHTSIVDVLESAGLMTKVDKGELRDGRLHLSFKMDQTGAKLCGVSGKKLSLDRADYDLLDRESLKAEPGFKIFVFHGAIEEMKPAELAAMEAMPVSKLPSGFDYYAGGHVHDSDTRDLPDHRWVTFPGPLFATDYRDLDPLASGAQRGFYIVDFDDQVRRVEFIPVKVCDVLRISYDANGKTAQRARSELRELVHRTAVAGKVVLLQAHGELSEGETSDIDFNDFRRDISSRGSLSVLLNYSQLISKDSAFPFIFGTSADQTERDHFARHIQGVKSSEPNLTGETGVRVSLDLLRTFKEERKENETKGDYQVRTEEAGLDILDLRKDIP